MIARVASFEGVNVPQASRTVDQAEAIIRPLLEGLAGYRGRLELVSVNGRVLSITLFDTEDNAIAAEAVFDEQLPERLGDLFSDWSGRRVAVDRYDVLAESRP